MATDEGTIDVPQGWDMLVQRRGSFSLYSPDRALTIKVLAIRRESFERDLRETAVRHLDTVGNLKGLEPTQRFDGERTIYYAEKIVRPGRVFAGCGITTRTTPDVVIMAVARLMDAEHVSKARFDAEGGESLLCRIAESATDLVRE